MNKNFIVCLFQAGFGLSGLCHPKRKPRFLVTLILITILLAGCKPETFKLPIDCNQVGSLLYVSVDPSTEIGIYLPPCYDLDVDRTYPVLYLLPGFGGSARDWFAAGLAPLADDLILAEEAVPFIIVTTDDSFDDLDANFIVERIIPYIESHYRVSQQRHHRAVAGGSLGGASAYHLAFKSPELFGSAGIFGNGAAIGEEDQIRSWLAATAKSNPPHVFLNSGKGDAYMLARAEVMISLLDEVEVDHTEIFGDGNHSYAYWLSNFPVYLRWWAKDW